MFISFSLAAFNYWSPPTCLGYSDVDNDPLVFLREILWGSFETECPIILFNHLIDANGLSISQPSDKRSRDKHKPVS